MNFKKLALFIVLLMVFRISVAQTIYQWRGANRDGVYKESNLKDNWKNNELPLLWEYEGLGNGYGSPVFTEDKMYILGEIDSTGYLFAFDLKGKLLWKNSYGKEWMQSYEGSRSTPTVVNDKIYVCSGLGNLYCFDLNTGKQIWMVDMLKDLHGKYTMFGHAESPLIYNDLVYLVPGGNDTNVVALNRHTGKLVWKNAGLGFGPGYNSPVIIQLQDKAILATFTAYAFMGLNANTGELLWSHLQDNTPASERKPGVGDTHSNTILYDNGFIYYFAGDGNCAVKLQLSNDGKQITQIWRNTKIDNYMGGFIKMNDYIYTCTLGKKDLRSIDVKTGEAADSLKIGTGSIIMADNMLYYYNQKGEVHLVKPQGPKLTPVSFIKIKKGTKEHFAHPVINKGVLYIRHGNAFMAFNIAKE